ncbi:sulfotransferase [Nocardioides pantholopis]|uniref:sulfotransferase n=1 Tax=Nocardioides pantholopis TaxID=2483798 RepID=UPI000FDAE549|nr:sulfotransferase [Nocardioides pantholopis]
MARTTVVYLGGFGRSGSTLIERTLGAAPGWTNVGELVDLARSVAPADELCGCGTPFSACPLWSEVGARAFGGWDPGVLSRLTALHRAAARQRHLPGLLARSGASTGTSTGGSTGNSTALGELRAAYTRIYRAVAEVTGCAVVVDASKGPALGQALAGAPELDVRVLNVVRDPRAVAWSWVRRTERPHSRDGEAMWRIPVHRAAVQWTALQLEMEAVARCGGAPFARLRYEDFVADPVGSLVAATAALGLPLAPADLTQVAAGRATLDASHGLSGNPSRFRSGTLAVRADDQWRTAMPQAHRTVVTALTLPLLGAYGYPTGVRPAPVRPETRSTP